MLEKLELILAAPPGDSRAALGFGLTVAHAAYRVGGGPHLYRAGPPLPVRGGLMALDCAGFDGRGDTGPLCREILRECAARVFTGVLCDFEATPLPPLVRALQDLTGPLAKRGWPLYVPEAYGEQVAGARVLISSALSGGSLSQRLLDALNQYGHGRVVLAVERVAEDFFLPSPDGQGTPLSREALGAMLEQRTPSVFFSDQLCAHYFTYMSRENGAHFVLFDDAGSIHKKLLLAHNLGIRQAVLAYPQVDDLLEDILREA